MSTYMEVTVEEEELRLGLEDAGREHDCEEAGCTMNPAGREIPAGPPARRKPLSGRFKALLKKLRGITVE